MTCTECGSTEMVPVVDEVDIGVGIQTFTRGYECACGNQVSLCDGCGRPAPGHAKWCGNDPLDEVTS